MPRAFRDPLLVLSLVAFALSLALEAFSVDGSAYSGWQCLAFGWWGIVSGCYAWLANPLLFASWATRGAGFRVAAAITAFLSGALMLSFLEVKALSTSTSGVRVGITHVGAGFGLWFLSGVLAFCAALQGVASPPTKPSSSNEGGV
jgi:hypothetical protein